MQRNTLRIAAGFLLAVAPATFADTKKASKTALTPEAAFSRTVQPFLASNCLGCHNAKAKTANLDLQQFSSVDSVRSNLKVWRKIAWKLEQGDMPPAKTPQPKPAAKKAFLRWVNSELEKMPIAAK